MREYFWNLYANLEYKACYYKYFLILISRINGILSGFFTLLSLSCVAAWGIWNDHPIVWSFLICAAQIIQALFPKLPYNDLLDSCKFIIPAMEKLIRSMRHDWLSLEIHDYSEEEILSFVEKYESQYAELVSQFFSSVYLPNIKWCEQKSKTECNNYFYITHHTGKEV